MIWEIDEASRTVEGLDELGRPRPEYAAALGLVRAPFGRRVLATLIEGVAVLLLQLPMLLVTLPALVGATLEGDAAAVAEAPGAVWVLVWGIVSSALTTVFVLVQLILHGRRGVTLGKALTGIRTVNVRTLERPTFWRGAVVRSLVLWVSFIVPVLGPLLVVALSPLFDPQERGRGWADLAGATWLVDIRNGLNPYDAKRMRIARKTVATDLRDEPVELPSLATPAEVPVGGVYVPASRNSGGVLGVPRGAAAMSAPAPATPVAPAPVAAPTPAPAPVPAPAPAAEPVPAPASVAFPAAPSRPVVSAPGETLAPPETVGGWTPPALLPAAASATLTLDTDETIELGETGAVLGRNPAAEGEDAAAQRIRVRDTTMSVSKTHLAVRWTGSGFVAVDLGSTNGSALERDGRTEPLGPGRPEPLRSGDVIHFGDRHARIVIA